MESSGKKFLWNSAKITKISGSGCQPLKVKYSTKPVKVVGIIQNAISVSERVWNSLGLNKDLQKHS